MNLRNSRFRSLKKKNLSSKDIKSSVKKRKKHAKSTRHSPKSSPETPLKSQKPVLDGILQVGYSSCSSSNMNHLTSTPIPNGIRKRTRSSVRCDIDKTVKLKSFNRLSCPIASSPIQKTLIQIKPCAVQLKPLVEPRGQRYSDELESDPILRSKKKLLDKKLSKISLNTSVTILRETRSRSTRSSMTLRLQNVSKILNHNKTPLSRKSKSVKKNFITEKHFNNSQKSAKTVLQNKSKNKNNVKKSSIFHEKHPMPSTSKDSSTVSDKSNEISIAKKFPGVSLISRDSFVQARYETDNSKSSSYRLRNSAISNQKSSCSKKVKGKKSLSESEKETETSQSSRYSLQLQNQCLFKRASGNQLSSDNLILQDKTKTPKSLLELNFDGRKRPSRRSLRLEKVQLFKKTTVNELSSEHSAKKTSTKKKKNHQNKASKLDKKSSSSRNQMSSKKSVIRNCVSLEGIPIDDLALSIKCPERRKVKSDGFKIPGKNTLKRKRCAIEAIIKADEDYEDDIYESKKFDQFKDLLMDTSDSERSFAVSTPKFPCTPLIRHKTPRFKDCFSPKEYEISRKAALEYIYRNKKRKSGQKPPETPVIVEKKRLEYSQVLEDAQKLQKSIENLTEEESDNDSYFSF